MEPESREVDRGDALDGLVRAPSSGPVTVDHCTGSETPGSSRFRDVQGRGGPPQARPITTARRGFLCRRDRGRSRTMTPLVRLVGNPPVLNAPVPRVDLKPRHRGYPEMVSIRSGVRGRPSVSSSDFGGKILVFRRDLYEVESRSLPEVHERRRSSAISDGEPPDPHGSAFSGRCAQVSIRYQHGTRIDAVPSPADRSGSTLRSSRFLLDQGSHR